MFDVIVIGGGPGGYLAAERAAHGGLKTLLIEKRARGGVCLNEGCIPSKALLNSAKTYEHALHAADYGVSCSGVTIDQKAVIARKARVVRTLVSGVRAKMKAAGVTVVMAEGTVTGKTAEGFEVAAGDEKYVGKHLIVATGSSNVIPPLPGLKENLGGFVLTNREVLELQEIPKEFVVIGGGVIGLEMAYYFASVGVKVTVIEMMPKIAGATDPEICKVLQDAFVKRGMVFKLSCKVLEVKSNSVVYEENGEKKEIACDKVLLSAGRRPATAGIGLETLGLQMDRAAIVTDRHLCTTVQNVYAIGDCNGKVMLAHTAYREAEVAVNHMLGKPDEMRYDVIPAVIYTDPEVASVGHSKEGAEKLGMHVKEVKLPMSYAGRYLAENEGGKGFIKLIVDTDRNRLVGCHMVGSYASEIIMTATMMVDTEMHPDRLKKLVFPHPTVAEMIREAIFHI